MIVESNLARALASGKFVATAELGPPKGADPDLVRKKAQYLRGHVVAVNITDNQTAIARMASMAAATIALQEGLEPVMQMTCRDRNRLAMSADLLGASALGIRNILCLTGDHTTFGNHPEAKPVFDLDSIQLVQMVRKMRDEGKFLCGEDEAGAPQLLIGAAENPFADPFGFRAVRLGKKVKAGAEFIQTQMIFNVPKFARWMEQVRERGLHERVKILAGVGPIKSAGAARYMKTSVPGMDVPDEIVARMAPLKGKAAREEGIRICIEIIEQVKQIPGVAGVHIMAIEWEEVVAEIVQAAKLN
jgi:5,10-methylenetetrahydrofolate reductase